LAIDIWPYAQRSSGAVNDAEHEILWSAVPDGILPGQAAGSGAVTVNAARAWTLAPAYFLVAGHVVYVDTTQSGTLAVNAGAARMDQITVYVDRSTNPWTKGVAIRQGTSGGGRPAAVRSRTVRWELVVAEAQVLNTGVGSLLIDYAPPLPRPAQTYGPGTPVSLAAQTTIATVNTLTVPAASFDRILSISAGCYLIASQVNDVFDLTVAQDGTQVTNGGWARQGSNGGLTITPTVTCTPILLPALTATTFTMRAARFSGAGSWGSTNDVHLNHFDILASPVGT
jgi:hypothetical protein